MLWMSHYWCCEPEWCGPGSICCIYHVKLLIISPSHTLLFRSKSGSMTHMQGWRTETGDEYLHKSFRIITFSLIYFLFVQLHLLCHLFHILDYNLIRPYLFCCLNFSRFVHWCSVRLDPVSLWYASFSVCFLSTSLLAGITGFWVHLEYFLPHLYNQPFSQGVWFLLLENIICS